MDEQAHPGEFAIRLTSVDELFYEFDARPVAERELADGVHDHLIDEWDRVRGRSPTELRVYAPAEEREDTHEDAVRAAIGTQLRDARQPLRRAGPLPRRQRVGMWVGIALLFVCIIISTALNRLSDNVVLEGVAQGIVVVGWVALWRPAEHFALQVVPHFFNRRRYAEFADLPVRFVWR